MMRVLAGFAALEVILYLAREIDGPEREPANELLENFERLSILVKELLPVPAISVRGRTM